ncbi:MAG: ABC transporter substrate-binding protein [Candidatus Omnitrophica bacterium]|nr:ABC transporter substrate-binding protein [Candidatus Omnitrophota bacterium]
MKIKNIRVIFVLALMFLILLNTNALAAQKILIAVYNDNPEYSAVREIFVWGLKQEVNKLGMKVEFAYLIDTDNRREFMQRLKEQARDAQMIFTAGTPNAMAIKEAGIKIPVLFSAVADPKKAHLVKSFHDPASNFTGAYCAVAAHTQLQMLLKICPQTKILGILYNPRDPGPVSQVQSWHKAASYVPGIKIMNFHIPQSVISEEGLAEVTKDMIGLVDVIVTMTDAQVSPFGRGMIEAANKNNIPTYVSMSELIEKGALVSLGFNFKEATKIVNIPQAIKILQGIPPSAIPVGTYPYYELIINLKTAQEIGVNFPNDIINSAAKIIK